MHTRSHTHNDHTHPHLHPPTHSLIHSLKHIHNIWSWPELLKGSFTHFQSCLLAKSYNTKLIVSPALKPQFLVFVTEYIWRKLWIERVCKVSKLDVCGRTLSHNLLRPLQINSVSCPPLRHICMQAVGPFPLFHYEICSFSSHYLCSYYHRKQLTCNLSLYLQV